MRFGSSCLFTLAVALTSSCTPLDSASDTAASVLGSGGQDSASSGGGNGVSAGGTTGNWACLAEPAAPFDRMPERIRYVVGIVDFDSQPPPNMPTRVEGLEVTVCGSPSCDPPFAAPDVVTVNPI